MSDNTGCNISRAHLILCQSVSVFLSVCLSASHSTFNMDNKVMFNIIRVRFIFVTIMFDKNLSMETWTVCNFCDTLYKPAELDQFRDNKRNTGNRIRSETLCVLGFFFSKKSVLPRVQCEILRRKTK